MTALQFGDIVLIEVEFHQGARFENSAGNSRYELRRTAGLNVASTVRLHKIAVLSKANIHRTVGRLTASDLASIRAKLCRGFCPDQL